jgi:hypothetical protein
MFLIELKFTIPKKTRNLLSQSNYFVIFTPTKATIVMGYIPGNGEVLSFYSNSYTVTPDLLSKQEIETCSVHSAGNSVNNITNTKI